MSLGAKTNASRFSMLLMPQGVSASSEAACLACVGHPHPSLDVFCLIHFAGVLVLDQCDLVLSIAIY